MRYRLNGAPTYKLNSLTKKIKVTVVIIEKMKLHGRDENVEKSAKGNDYDVQIRLSLVI